MAANPTIPSMDGSVGALEIAAVVGTFLAGISFIQGATYFRKYSDPPITQLTVAAVVITDVLQTILLLVPLYQYSVTDWGNNFDTTRIAPSLTVSVLLAGLIAYMVQSFFARRLWVLTHNKPLALSALALATLRFLLNCALGGAAFAHPTFAALRAQFTWLAIAALVACVAADVLIAGALCVVLVREKTTFSRSDDLIDKLLVLIVGTSALTSIVTVVELICLLVMDNLVWVALRVLMPKLFSNALLVNLHVRKMLRDTIPQRTPQLFELSPPTTPNSPYTFSGRKTHSYRSSGAFRFSRKPGPPPLALYRDSLRFGDSGHDSPPGGLDSGKTIVEQVHEE